MGPLAAPHAKETHGTQKYLPPALSTLELLHSPPGSSHSPLNSPLLSRVLARRNALAPVKAPPYALQQSQVNESFCPLLSPLIVDSHPSSQVKSRTFF